MEPEREQRIFDFEVEARAAGDGVTPGIHGTAAVYNRWSEDLGGFREMIEPGFFDDVLKNDVRALWNHNPDLVLGRTKSGTLALQDTERGLDVHIDPPDTQAGRDAMTLIERRDVTQMSFMFTVKPDGDSWSREKDGTILRVLKRGGAQRLYDVSPVTFPAYPQTSVHVRSMIEELSGEGEPEPANEARETARIKHANRRREIELLEKE